METESVEQQLAALRREVTALQQQSVRRVRRRWFGVALLTVVVSSLAWAQLVTFNADTPALASEVNGNFTQLKTWLETKVGVATAGGITASAPANMNGNRITNTAQPSANDDVVTKAHLKALFAGMVIWVTGPSCPTGFVRYGAGEGRYPLGDNAGSQGQGGATTLQLFTMQQQASGVGYHKTGAVGIRTDGNGVSWSTDVNNGGQIYGPWTQNATASIDIRPVWIQLKPCIFNSAY